MHSFSVTKFADWALAVRQGAAGHLDAPSNDVKVMDQV